MLDKLGAIGYMGMGRELSIVRLGVCDVKECRFEIDKGKGVYTEYGRGIINDYHIRRYVEVDQKGRVLKDESFNTQSNLVMVATQRGGKLYRYVMPDFLYDSLMVRVYLGMDVEGLQKVYTHFPYVSVYKFVVGE